MKQFVDEIEDRASIGNAQTHECTFAAFVQDEAEVVHHIENRLVVRLSRMVLETLSPLSFFFFSLSGISFFSFWLAGVFLTKDMNS